MLDPRSPELQAWIDSMPTTWDQVVTMHALCFAFPFLRRATLFAARGHLPASGDDG
jgi:hypothetical protein